MFVFGSAFHHASNKDYVGEDRSRACGPTHADLIAPEGVRYTDVHGKNTAKSCKVKIA